MNSLGNLFFNDKKDFEQAVGWFSKAAERGYTQAITNLGVCYEEGLGVDRDWDRAIKLFQESSHKGHVKAMYNLSSLFYKMATQNSQSQLGPAENSN